MLYDVSCHIESFMEKEKKMYPNAGPLPSPPTTMHFALIGHRSGLFYMCPLTLIQRRFLRRLCLPPVWGAARVKQVQGEVHGVKQT